MTTNHDMAHLRAAPITGRGELLLTDESAEWSLHIPPDDPVFAGHYPAAPIFPGVYTLDLIFQCAEHFFRARGNRVSLTAVKSIRYTRAISPGDCIRIKLDLDTTRGGQEVLARAVVFLGEAKAVSARLLLRVNS